MKIRKFKGKHIFKLHLLNSRIYEHIVKKTGANFITDLNLTKVVSEFKRVLYLIFQFHSFNKKILFIGMPKKLETRINKSTSHLAVPSSFDAKEFFSISLKTSKAESIRSTANFGIRSLLPELTTRPDLIVVFSHEKPQSVVNESSSQRIPVILFNADLLAEPFSSKVSYMVSVIGHNSTSRFNTELFLIGLNFLFPIRKKQH